MRLTEHIAKLKNIDFFKNVFTLAIGSVLSQCIVVASAPLLSRMYTPVDFGLLSLFTSLSVFLAVVSTGRYELVVPIPKSDHQARAVMHLILRIALSIALFYGLVVFVINRFSLTENLLFTSSAAYLIPVYIFLLGCYSALGYWLQRKTNYKKLSLANAIQAISTVFFSLLLGYFNFLELGLILGLIFGVFASSIFVLAHIKDDLKKTINSKLIWGMAKQYSSFPKFQILSDLSLAATQQLVPLFISFLYSTEVLGYYSMGNRFLRLPVIVLASAVSSVFRNDIIAVQGNKVLEYNIFIKTFKRLAVVSVPVFFLLFWIMPWAFRVFFGQQWELSGEMAQILIFVILTEFIIIPLASIFYLKGQQQRYMYLQMVLLSLSLGGLYAGKLWFDGIFSSLLLLAIATVIVNAILLYNAYRLVRE